MSSKSKLLGKSLNDKQSTKTQYNNKNFFEKITEDFNSDSEVTHEVFFGENIRRVIKAFSNK